MTDSFAFPHDFLWGLATAAHQVEGNNVNSDCWFLERLPGTIFAEPSGDAVDHYHRYREDIALIAGLGFTSYRFSWSGPASSPRKATSRWRNSTITAACWRPAMSTGSSR